MKIRIGSRRAFWRYGAHRRTAIAALTFVFISASSGLAQTEVSSCGQSLSGAGYLAADLDCSAYVGPSAVELANGSLDLRGFTLAGNVRCTANCTVHSTTTRGRVVFSGIAIHAEPPERIAALRVENVEIQGGGIFVVGSLRMADSIVDNSPEQGVLVYDTFSHQGGFATIATSIIRGSARSGIETEGRLSITDSEVSMNGEWGIRSDSNLKMLRCDILNNGTYGAESRFGRLKVTDSTVTGNTIGLDGSGFGGMSIRGSNISGNSNTGVVAPGSRRAKVKDSTISSNGVRGIDANYASVVGSTIQNNGVFGILISSSSVLGVSDSTLTGNGNAPECAVDTICADIATNAAPRIKQTVCDRSVAPLTDPLETWGVCSLD